MDNWKLLLVTLHSTAVVAAPKLSTGPKAKCTPEATTVRSPGGGGGGEGSSWVNKYQIYIESGRAKVNYIVLTGRLIL